MEDAYQIVTHGVDTLILNVRYSGASQMGQVPQRELPNDLVARLNHWQAQARAHEEAVPTSLVFKEQALLMYPHGAGRQWSWLLSCDLLSLSVSTGRFNGIVGRVRFSSEYLWSSASLADAIVEVIGLLGDVFGAGIELQPSEVHLCADLVGWSPAEMDWRSSYLSRARRRTERAYLPEDEGGKGRPPVVIDSGRQTATLEFGSHGSPLSCCIYNKTLEIKQKARKKVWFHDLWRTQGWDGQAQVWRVEFRFRREALHEIREDGVFDGVDDLESLLVHLSALWVYAVGHFGGAEDGLPDGWLRCVVPGLDSNRARWEVHPAWAVLQQAFLDSDSVLCDEQGEPVISEEGEVLMRSFGKVIRTRKRQVNVQQLVLQIIGCTETLAAWLGGNASDQGGHVPTFIYDHRAVFRWLQERGVLYRLPKGARRDADKARARVQRQFGEAVHLKRVLYHLQAA
jgi:hypothetical protein